MDTLFDIDIPLSVFRRTSLTVFEALVVYLRDTCRLTYRDIGRLLARDERNIWTVYHRALKKLRSQQKKGEICD